ncbi:hypothetical protein B9Z55_026509 [Caenorhabditis nigoni]|uniref:Sdz-33 F-box domain-containing protein n=1 Tax=Caenorhabditis nigoni TaxID=1611254 RepID=A0A2G5T3G9_9PELO|nr:hypothetical protein B9Z55_026509 [Caenorhabditis nigoni]
MEEQPVIHLQFEGSFFEFTLELQRHNTNTTNLYEFPIEVKVKHWKEAREVESTISNQQMKLVEWIRHISLFSENRGIDFHVEHTNFDIPTLRKNIPKMRGISVTCSKEEPDEHDILNAQKILIPFLSDVQNVELHRVPLQENFSLTHIGMVHLKELELNYQNNLNFLDVAAWNVESCVITTMADQISLRDLNRFFKLWIKGSNPKLKEFFVYWNTETIPDWNPLLKGLKAIEKWAIEEEKHFIIRNNRDISADIKVEHFDGDTASVCFFLSD